MTQIKSILVPVDFSKHSAAAVDFAIELASRYGASIELQATAGLTARAESIDAAAMDRVPGDITRSHPAARSAATPQTNPNAR
jgi:hypothetical protein